MPNPTTFALWQARTGLVRAGDAATALGLTRRSVERLRNGEQQPHPSTLRLMDLLAEHPELFTPATRP